MRHDDAANRPKGDLLTGLWSRTTAPVWTDAQWECLFSQARRARLLGRVALVLQNRGWTAQAPPPARIHLRNAMRTVARQRAAVRWEVDCIQRAIGHLPTPIVLLKGAAYVLADLPPAQSRRFGDVDILVAADQLAAVEAALAAHGWSALPLEPDDDRYYRDLTHELPPLHHAERGSILDVHHSITQPGSHFAVNAASLLARARPLTGQPRLSVLAPADMVLHSAVHLMQEGDFARGQRDLLDLHDLISSHDTDPDFWPELVERAATLGVDAPLLDMLNQARQTLGLVVPQTHWQHLCRRVGQPLRRRCMAALLRIALRPDHPAADLPATCVVRWCLYVRSHWIRMPLHQTIPHLLRKAWVRSRQRPPGTQPTIAADTARNRTDPQ